MQSRSGSDDLAGLLRLAQDALDRASALLSNPNPESLELTQPMLREASDALARYCAAAPGAPQSPGRTQAAAAVREQTLRLETLFRHAHAFHQGWIQTVAAGASGYTADGATDLGGAHPTVSYDC